MPGLAGVSNVPTYLPTYIIGAQLAQLKVSGRWEMGDGVVEHAHNWAGG